jgi:hypothetical protein
MRLRMVIDDPYTRELLTNRAFESGIDVDTSFSREIVTLTWPSYVALLRSLAGDEGVDEALESFAAEIRAALRRNQRLQREFEELLQEPETRTERFARAGKFVVDYGLPLAGAAGRLLR